MRSRTTLGLVLIALGLVFTLDSAGIMRIGGLARWWPLLLVGAGIVKFRQPRTDGQRASGIAMLLLGGFFQATSLLANSSGWSLIMVAVGAFLVWLGVDGPRRNAAALASDSPYLTDLAFMGFCKRTHVSRDFRGGSVTVVMGGVELDLRGATIAGGAAYLDLAAVWGGIEVKVPNGWIVEAHVVPLLGAFEDKIGALEVAGGPRLVVRGNAVMGGIVIRH